MPYVCPICSGPVEKKFDRGPAPTFCSMSCRQKSYRRARARKEAALVAGLAAAVEALTADETIG